MDAPFPPSMVRELMVALGTLKVTTYALLLAPIVTMSADGSCPG